MSKNNVKRLRTSLRLTQKKLAEKVGTSQQQIQRIEAGSISTSLATANAISAALGQPLTKVFPSGAAAVAKFRKVRDSRRYYTDSDLDEVSKAGIEVDSAGWYLKLILEDTAAPRFFPISPSEKRRLYSSVQDENDDGGVEFLVFDSEGERIAINKRCIAFAQFLMEPFGHWLVAENAESEKEDSQDQRSGGVKIEIFGMTEALQLFVDQDIPDEDGIGQVGNVFFFMETATEPSQRCRIIDEDGEDAFIRLGSIRSFHAPLWVLGEGDDEEELSEVE